VTTFPSSRTAIACGYSSTRNTLLKNRYAASLHRDGLRWVIHRLRVDTIWHAGNPGAVFTRPYN
jgi:hypothetical protein